MKYVGFNFSMKLAGSLDSVCEVKVRLRQRPGICVKYFTAIRAYESSKLASFEENSIYISYIISTDIIDCQLPKLVGDGYCHDSTNNFHCGFDGGDCCGKCVNKDYCTECECKKGDVEAISNALVGDGFCQESTNNFECDFDGGDCCGSCVNTKYCIDCDCKGQSNGNGKNNPFLANGFCQDQLNHAECNFDGFDCCSADLMEGSIENIAPIASAKVFWIILGRSQLNLKA